MIIIPMCPLSKIFCEDMQTELMKNPSKVFSEESFSITIKTSRRDYRFDFNQPKYETNSMLLNWLLGGDDGLQNQETDWTGLVGLDLDSVQNGAIIGAVAGITKIDSNLQTAIEDAKERAKKLSKERVMKQIRTINQNMLKQYEINKSEGKSIYTPSATEFLCAYVLADEQKRTSEERKEIANKFSELLASTFGG